MNTNQQAQVEIQDDITARLALISQAVQEKLASKKSAPVAEASQPDVFVVSACPIDPMERLQCESCQ